MDSTEMDEILVNRSLRGLERPLKKTQSMRLSGGRWDSLLSPLRPDLPSLDDMGVNSAPSKRMNQLSPIELKQRNFASTERKTPSFHSIDLPSYESKSLRSISSASRIVPNQSAFKASFQPSQMNQMTQPLHDSSQLGSFDHLDTDDLISSFQDFSLHRSQSLRVPPGFENRGGFSAFGGGKSSSRLNVADLDQDLLGNATDQRFNSRDAARGFASTKDKFGAQPQLKRFVTFAGNLQTHNPANDSQFVPVLNRNGMQDGSDDEEDLVDVDVSLVEDEMLMEFGMGNNSGTGSLRKEKLSVVDAVGRINSTASMKSLKSATSLGSSSTNASQGQSRLHRQNLRGQNQHMPSPMREWDPRDFPNGRSPMDNLHNSASNYQIDISQQQFHHNTGIGGFQSQMHHQGHHNNGNQFMQQQAQNNQSFGSFGMHGRMSPPQTQSPPLSQISGNPHMIHSMGSMPTSPTMHSMPGMQGFPSMPGQQFNGMQSGLTPPFDGDDNSTQAQLMQQTMQNQMLMNLVMQQNAIQQNLVQSMQGSPQHQASQNRHFPNVMKSMNQMGANPANLGNLGGTNLQPGMPSAGEFGRNVSNLLIRHKTTGYRPNLRELQGSVVEFSRDSHGSRLVQCLMETASPSEKESLINEVLAEGVSLMQDLFGNYVMQNFLEHCTDPQRAELASQIKKSINLLSFQPHGCRVVQRAIDIFPSAQRNELLKEVLFPNEQINKCAKDPHATHVLQKAVALLQKEINIAANPNTAPKALVDLAEENQTLLDCIEHSVASDVLQLAIHPHACRLVQKTLGDCNYSRSAPVAEMMEIVRKVFPMLSVDQHGNFIMQHILDKGNETQKAEVQAFVCGKFIELAQHKFGSHLVEKCLQTADEEQSQSLVQALVTPALELRANGSEGDDVLMGLMKDPYANFVVQRAFDASKGSLRQIVVREVHDRADVLSRFTYGRHILSHVNRSE